MKVGIGLMKRFVQRTSPPTRSFSSLKSFGLSRAFCSTFASSSGNLKLHSQVGFLPHPSKVAKGGEDAFFIGEDGNSIGVADGVGGWAEVGVDPAIYARNLMLLSKEAYDKEKKKEPLEILNFAYNKMNKKLRGSSTACILVLDSKKIDCANLGDSGFALYRRSQDGGFKSIYKSKEQQHQFNYPYQLGTESTDLPSHADKITHRVQVGDIIALGTDGLFDNLYDWQIAAILNKHLNSPIQKLQDVPQQNLAEVIAQSAQKIGKMRHTSSPFAESAEKHGKHWSGGKLDDITVILTFVVENSPNSKL